MWYENIPRVVYEFMDREGTVASLDCYFPFDSDRDSLWNAIKQETRIAGVSDCLLVARKMILGAAQTETPDPIGSNLAYGVFVLETAIPSYTTIMIPGIKPDYLQQSGCFAFQGLDLTHPDLVAFASAIADAGLVSERGDPAIALVSGVTANMWSELQQRSG